jgi:hypothetical protein
MNARGCIVRCCLMRDGARQGCVGACIPKIPRTDGKSGWVMRVGARQSAVTAAVSASNVPLQRASEAEQLVVRRKILPRNAPSLGKVPARSAGLGGAVDVSLNDGREVTYLALPLSERLRTVSAASKLPDFVRTY